MANLYSGEFRTTEALTPDVERALNESGAIQESSSARNREI